MTTRNGGKSIAPFASLNLGDHVGDHVLSVGANRAVLSRAIQAKPVFMRQVHGHHTCRLDTHSHQGDEGDASVTEHPGVACTVLVADCLPILLTNEGGSVAGAVHAGWRGLLGAARRGVLESACDEFMALALMKPRHTATNMIAWLGPCIGPEKFEVGADVRNAYLSDDRASAPLFRAIAPGKWLANLPGLARQRLQRLGISAIYGNDGSTAWCTVSNPSQFFSYRRDGACGRMAACIWLR